MNTTSLFRYFDPDDFNTKNGLVVRKVSAGSYDTVNCEVIVGNEFISKGRKVNCFDRLLTRVHNTPLNA